MEHIKDKKRYTNRVTHLKVNTLHVPTGGDLTQIQFARWRFFTDSGQWKWDELMLDKEDAIKLCIDIAEEYDIDTMAEREISKND